MSFQWFYKRGIFGDFIGFRGVPDISRSALEGVTWGSRDLRGNSEAFQEALKDLRRISETSERRYIGVFGESQVRCVGLERGLEGFRRPRCYKK